MLPTNDILARDRVPVRTRAEDIADERNRRQNVVRFGAMLCIMLTLFDGSQNARMAAIQQQQQRGQTQGRGGSGTETGSQGQHIPPAALDPKFLGHVNFITSTASSAPLSSSFSSQAQMDQYRGYSGADSTGTNPNLSQVIAQERSATNATGIYHGTWDSPNSFLQAGLVGLEKAASPAPSQAHPDGSAAKATSDGRLLQDIETKDYISHSKLSSTSIDANKSSRGPLFLQLRASPLPGLLHVSFLFGLVTLGKAGPQMQDLLVPVQGLYFSDVGKLRLLSTSFPEQRLYLQVPDIMAQLPVSPPAANRRRTTATMLHNAHDSVDDVISAASMAETILQRGCQWLLEHLPLSVSLQKRVHRTNVALQEPSAHTDEFLQPRRGLASSSLPLQPPLTHSFTHRGYELHLLTAMPAQPNLDSAPPVTASSGVSVANELARPGYIIQDVGGALPSPFHNIQAGLLNNAIDLKQPVCQLVLDLQAAIVPVDDSGEPVHAVPLLPTASGASALVNNAAAGASTARLAVSEDALQSRQLYVSAVEGTVFSPNCHANYTANVHSYQLEVGALQETSSSYAAIAVFIACTQIGLLVLQIYHSGSAAQALKLSILSVCAHAVLDALLCIGHLLLSSAVPGLLLRDLLWLAILKLIIFCVFEMRLAISAYQAQYAQEANPEGTMGLRRRLAAMHLRFYGAVFASMFIALSLSSQPLWLVPLLYSFWVPQIVYNVTHVVRRALHPVYIVGMSLTRMFIPLYLYGWPNSFVHYILLDDGSQEIEHARAACVLLVLWVSLQAVVLLLQDRFGSRFLVPKAWLPERYDYYRDLPQGVHARPISGDNVSSGDHGADGEAGIALNVVEGGRSSVHTGAGDYSECVVCYNPIEAIPGSYMVAPCDHTFHRDCLTHWMQVKSECPTCRATLPPDELAEAD